MPKAKDKRVEEAFKLYREGLKLIEISKQLDVAEGTVRSWKNRYKWEGDKNATLHKKDCNVANKKRNTKKAAVEEVKTVLKNTDLTSKQQLFCIHYIRCFNATKAYQKAYECSYSAAAVNGSMLLRNTKVKARILELKQERLNRELLSEEDIFQKYIDLAFADITDYAVFGTREAEYVDKKGIKHKANMPFVDLKDSNKVDGTLISEISQGKDGAKIKLSDRMKALQWLSDHMDLATEKQRVEIQAIKAKIELNDDTGHEDDGFIDALNATAKEDWCNEEDS
ncbi:MAG: phage portal protein [Eubacterium sp.]|nr:phage portal protein [Eubacterium sp.]